MLLELSLDHYILILFFKEENCLFYSLMCSEIGPTIQNPTQLPPATTCCEFSAAIICIGKVHQQEKRFRRKHLGKLRMSKAFQEMFRKQAFSKGHHIFINMQTLFFIFVKVVFDVQNFVNGVKISRKCRKRLKKRVLVPE